MKRARKLIIAIDGPAGSGKSTTAKLLASCLKVPYVDTGAMYRAITLKAMNEKVPFEDTKKLVVVAKKATIHLSETKRSKQKVFLDGKDVTKTIRTPELTKNVFRVAQNPAIRRVMVKKQRILGRKQGAVMEGRDIGTVVFPKADYKFYLIADPRLRAERRYKELIAAGKQVTLKEVIRDQKKRDAKDRNRKVGPLKKAKDAFLIDTTPLTIQGTVARILAVVRSNPLKGFKLAG